MRFGRKYQRRNIKIGQKKIEDVRSFKQLGMTISNKGEKTKDMEDTLYK